MNHGLDVRAGHPVRTSGDRTIRARHAGATIPVRTLAAQYDFVDVY